MFTHVSHQFYCTFCVSVFFSKSNDSHRFWSAPATDPVRQLEFLLYPWEASPSLLERFALALASYLARNRWKKILLYLWGGVIPSCSSAPNCLWWAYYQVYIIIKIIPRECAAMDDFGIQHDWTSVFSVPRSIGSMVNWHITRYQMKCIYIYIHKFTRIFHF